MLQGLNELLLHVKLWIMEHNVEWKNHSLNLKYRNQFHALFMCILLKIYKKNMQTCLKVMPAEVMGMLGLGGVQKGH